MIHFHSQNTIEAIAGINAANQLGTESNMGRQVMETLSVLLAYCEGNPSVIDGFPLTLCGFVVFRLSNERWSRRFFKMARRSYDVIVVMS